jgi:hypothetical protein
MSETTTPLPPNRRRFIKGFSLRFEVLHVANRSVFARTLGGANGDSHFPTDAEKGYRSLSSNRSLLE